MSTLKSGELAKQAGVSVETLRYYENEKLLPEPPRTASGYRLYPVSDVHRIFFIKRAQFLGFSLEEIRELLSLQSHSDNSAKEVKAMAEKKLHVIDEKIQALQLMHATLEQLAKNCPGEDGTVAHCPIIESLTTSSQKGGD